MMSLLFSAYQPYTPPPDVNEAFQHIDTQQHTLIAPFDRFTEHTFEDVPFGAVAPGREVIVVLQVLSPNTDYDASITIGNDTSPVLDAQFLSGRLAFKVFRGTPTGSSGDVVVNTTTEVQSAVITVYRLNGPRRPMQSTSWWFAGGNRADVNVEVPTGGTCLIVSSRIGGSVSANIAYDPEFVRDTHTDVSALGANGTFGCATRHNIPARGYYPAAHLIANEPVFSSQILAVSYGSVSDEPTHTWVDVFSTTQAGSEESREDMTLRSRLSNALVSNAPYYTVAIRALIRTYSTDMSTLNTIRLRLDNLFLGNGSTASAIAAENLFPVLFGGSAGVALHGREYKMSDPSPFTRVHGRSVQISAKTSGNEDEAHVWRSIYNGGHYWRREGINESSVLLPEISEYTQIDSIYTALIQRLEMAVEYGQPTDPWDGTGDPPWHGSTS